MKSNKVSTATMFNTQIKLARSIIVGSIFTLTSSLSYANSLGLQDVYKMALQHDALLAQAESQYQADMQGLDTARASLLPQIQADGSYFITDGSVDSADVTSRDLSITLNQSLYKHEYWARYEQSKYLVEAADATLKNAQQDLILRVTQAYFDVLLAQETVRLAKSKEAADFTQYETAQASAELGLSSRVDVLQAKSSYDLSKSETINAENGLDVTLEALSKLTGKPVSQFESGMLKQLLPHVKLPRDERATSLLEKRAETENLLVKQAQSQLSIAAEEIEVQRGGYWPTVALQAKYSDTAYSDYNSSYSSSYNDNNKTSVGVTLSVPLYSGGSTDSQVAAAKYETIASQQALRDAQETARLNVRTQKRNLERGQKLVAALREAVKSNDAFLESAEEGYKVGITKTFPCSYLPDQEERLLIAVDERLQNNYSYSLLMTEGFRRTGDQSYRPHCPACNACQSIRIIVDKFIPSKSQKRTIKRNAHFQVLTSDRLKEDYYPLYEQYINTCHQDGSMFPANYQQFESFLSSKLTQQLFIETWVEVNEIKRLVCVAVTDVLINGLSAVYTFYHPDFRAYGLGVFSILTQIEFCKKNKLPYLYLGYQIDECQKMNYKNRYFPYEKFSEQQWILVEK